MGHWGERLQTGCRAHSARESRVGSEVGGYAALLPISVAGWVWAITAADLGVRRLIGGLSGTATFLSLGQGPLGGGG